MTKEKSGEQGGNSTLRRKGMLLARWGSRLNSLIPLLWASPTCLLADMQVWREAKAYLKHGEEFIWIQGHPQPLEISHWL